MSRGKELEKLKELCLPDQVVNVLKEGNKRNLNNLLLELKHILFCLSTVECYLILSLCILSVKKFYFPQQPPEDVSKCLEEAQVLRKTEQPGAELHACSPSGLRG